jgi:hypothetical protein
MAQRTAFDQPRGEDQMVQRRRRLLAQALASCSFIAASWRALSSLPFTATSRSTSSMTARGALSP